MLKRLRRNFILTAMSAIFIVFLILVSGINLVYRHITVSNLDGTLALLAENGGRFPRGMGLNRPEREPSPFTQPITPETPFETRFFVVWADSEGGEGRKEMGAIAAVSEEEAEQYYAAAAGEKSDRGFVGQYRYLRGSGGEGEYIIFLNAANQLRSMESILLISALVALGGLIVTFLLVLAFSRRTLAPIARNMESQKQFITDASHELKTPLAVISSHADILCMEDEGNEWAQGIRREVAQMTGLVGDLVLLSRWDEEAPIRDRYDFDLSGAVWDTLAPFRRMAEARGKSISAQVAEGITFNGDEGALQTALSTLLENAVKYSLPESEITLSLEKSRRSILLEVSNACRPDYRPELDRLFDRFYRADPSRARSSGGHGVGLSIAKAIVEAHKGRISAAMPENGRIVFRIQLPA